VEERKWLRGAGWQLVGVFVLGCEFGGCDRREIRQDWTHIRSWKGVVKELNIRDLDQPSNSVGKNQRVIFCSPRNTAILEVGSIISTF
jgi:hypothetical protein